MNFFMAWCRFLSLNSYVGQAFSAETAQSFDSTSISPILIVNSLGLHHLWGGLSLQAIYRNLSLVDSSISATNMAWSESGSTDSGRCRSDLMISHPRK